MGRSVSVPHYATVVAYQIFEPNDQDDEREWDEYLYDLRERCISVWPSLSVCDEWLGREDHAILENQLAYIGVSEYCGLVAIWARPRYDGDNDALGENWTHTIAPKFHAMFGELRRLGTMSNGVSVYKRKERV